MGTSMFFGARTCIQIGQFEVVVLGVLINPQASCIQTPSNFNCIHDQIFNKMPGPFVSSSGNYFEVLRYLLLFGVP